MFYDRLNFLCKQANTTITQFAAELGINKSTPNGWKKGSSPSADIVAKAALRFDVSADYLLELPEKIDGFSALGDDERELIRMWREAEPAMRAAALSVLRTPMPGREKMEPSSHLEDVDSAGA